MTNHILAEHFATQLAIDRALLQAVRDQIKETRMEIALKKLVLDSLLDRLNGDAGV